MRTRTRGFTDVDLRLRDIRLLNRRPDAVIYDAALPDDEVLRPQYCTLVVEVMSPGSVTAGQTDKPAEYAAAASRTTGVSNTTLPNKPCPSSAAGSTRPPAPTHKPTFIREDDRHRTGHPLPSTSPRCSEQTTYSGVT
jgi:hypothetical protein